MKKALFTIQIFFLLLAVSPAKTNKQDFYKVIEKQFNADASTLVDITNKYGDVVIKDWQKSSVKITVKIRVKESSQAKANNTFEKIDITITHTGNVVKALTELNSSISNVDFSIDYEIFMPKDLKINLSNKYGGVFINELTNLVNISVKYGSLKINSLTRGKEERKNTVYIAYSKASIGYANWLKIEAAYSNLDIDKAYALIVLSKYSNWNIDKVTSMVMDSKYDQPVNIGIISNFVITEGKYADYNIEHLKRYLETNIRYSNLEVENLDAGFEAVKANLKYGKIAITVASDASYRFAGETEYGDINVDLSEITISESKGSYDKIVGYKGKAKAQSLIDISGKYSNIEVDED